MCVITPAGLEGFPEEVAALNPQQQADIPRIMESGRRCGLLFPPPLGAEPNHFAGAAAGGV
jgi:hypothetical protein